MRTTTVLRQLITDRGVVAASIFDPMSARMAELAGFEALHLTGFGFEATQIGAPDLGLMTLTELAAQAARICLTVSIPVVVDVDTGFGGVLNVQRTIREIERAGAAGVHLEDQMVPKHCPVLSGRQIVSREEAVGRIKAACDARTDADFIIAARTDADVISFDEVVERANLYLEAGADLVMPMLLEVNGAKYFELTPDEQMEWLRRLAAQINGPVMGMGISPPSGYTHHDIVAAGYKFSMYALSAAAAAANAMADIFREIRTAGTDEGYFKRCPGEYSSPLALMKALYLDDYVEVERRFASEPEVSASKR